MCPLLDERQQVLVIAQPQQLHPNPFNGVRLIWCAISFARVAGQDFTQHADVVRLRPGSPHLHGIRMQGGGQDAGGIFGQVQTQLGVNLLGQQFDEPLSIRLGQFHPVAKLGMVHQCSSTKPCGQSKIKHLGTLA